MLAPCASTHINGWCRVCSQAAYLCWLFVLFDLFSYLRAANLVLHKLPDPLPSFFPFSTKRSVPYRCVYWVTPFLPFRPTKRLDSQSILLFLPPFLIEPRPRFMLCNFSHYFPPFLSSLNHVLDLWYTTFPTTFLFDPTPRFECRSGKKPTCS